MKECQYCIFNDRNDTKFEKLIWLTRMYNCACLEAIPFPGSAPDGQIELKGHDLNQDQSRSLHRFMELYRYLNPHMSGNYYPYLPDSIMTITLEGGIIKHLTLKYEGKMSMYEALTEWEKQEFQDWVEEHENGGQ